MIPSSGQTRPTSSFITSHCAGYCGGYEGSNGYRQEAQDCGSQYCCGNCERKYCCSNITQHLSQEVNCSGSTSDLGTTRLLGNRLGSIMGRILPIVLVICCVAPCCFFFKKCRIGDNQSSSQIMLTSYTPVGENVPEQSLSHPYGYQPAYRGYQRVPAEPHYESRPTLAAPPPYTESTAFLAEVPVVAFSGQPYAPSPHSAPMPFSDAPATPLMWTANETNLHSLPPRQANAVHLFTHLPLITNQVPKAGLFNFTSKWAE
ncbi:hypothetical protein EYF80_007546 [Liparis tanakae]|uniref:Shisa N-terminal domain-containing protein n=1 Tax=Liparis tanakae TaxID=230148 RepID=A0A4Z2IXE7_9TELE|nr:hypothetical protein EYF80_007546 [Liparis tanakae]